MKSSAIFKSTELLSGHAASVTSLAFKLIFALSLVLKVRVFGTRKWSLVQIYLIEKLFQVLEIWLLVLAFYQESTRGVKPTRNWIMFLMNPGRIYCLSSCFEHILLFRAIMREFKCAIQI